MTTTPTPNQTITSSDAVAGSRKARRTPPCYFTFGSGVAADGFPDGDPPISQADIEQLPQIQAKDRQHLGQSSRIQKPYIKINTTKFLAVPNKLSPSCQECRTLHRKCNRDQPKCEACRKHGRQCNYSPRKVQISTGGKAPRKDQQQGLKATQLSRATKPTRCIGKL